MTFISTNGSIEPFSVGGSTVRTSPHD